MRPTSSDPTGVRPGFERVALREIDFNITNRCNLSCIHCAFASGGEEADELPLTVIEAIIADAKRLGCREIHLTGGEPTVHRDFDRVLASILEAGLFTRLISNGIVGAQKLRSYRAMGLGHVLFSLDGMAATHDRIRNRPGAFATTVRRVEQALALGYHVRVNAVAMRQNLHELVQLYDLCAGMGVPLFSVFLYSPTGRNASRQLDLLVDPLEWRQVKRTLGERCQGRPTEVFVEKGFWFPDEPEPDWTAMSGRGGGCPSLASVLDYLLIAGDGNVFPCALLNDKHIPYGNVYERSLPEIVEQPDHHYPTYRGFQDLPGGCDDCAVGPACRGGCRAITYAFHGEWDRPDPRCRRGVVACPTVPFVPLCPLFKENLAARETSGFSERLS